MKVYEQAVKEFVAADKEYKDTEERFTSGKWVEEAFTANASLEGIKEYFQGMLNLVGSTLEVRNDRLKNAADALRQSVVLTTTQWRGPDGKATMSEAGPFKVSSVTHRSFDPPSLFNLVDKHGLRERLMELTSINKDGKTYHLVEQKWDIDYPSVLQWLRANQLTDIIDGAYDEKEKTPQVKGPKPLAFLGEKKD